MSALDIAAPIARELNKGDVGDYFRGGIGPFLKSMGEHVAKFGVLPFGDPPGGFGSGAPEIPLTETDYQNDLPLAEKKTDDNLFAVANTKNPTACWAIGFNRHPDVIL